jgi:hypothetical protein
MHEERKHAVLSASSAYRWLNCTPSARLEEKFVEENSSVYAKEGTLAHEFSEAALRLHSKLLTTRAYNQLIKGLKANKLYSPEMDTEVDKYVNIVLEELAVSKKQTSDAVLMIEEKLDLTKYIEDGFGTGDALIIADKTLKVIDLKYGKGIRVNPENNPQLMLYGLGALEAVEIFYDIDTVELMVVQPRLDHFAKWAISVEELKAWAKNKLVVAAAKAYAGEGLQQAGSWCQFCKAAPKCATLASVNMKLIDDQFSDPHLLKDQHMIDIFNKSSQITNWLNAVTGYMLKEAIAGKIWPGLKLVEGRSNRKWSDEEKVKETLRAFNFTDEQILTIKLQGITAIEKLLGKKRFAEILSDLTIKPAGAPTLTGKDDPRPEFKNNAENDFENL